MRTRVNKWLMQCDYCKAEVDLLTAITGLSGGRDDYAIFETPWGYIYCDEDSCWCTLGCLIAWLKDQYSKLIKEVN